MGKQYASINEKLTNFFLQLQIFLVATTALEGRIDLSPKGMDSLRILSTNQLVWLNLTGSGNETLAHLLEDDRMTLMFCASSSCTWQITARIQILPIWARIYLRHG